jgi:hypothetical protein
MGVRGTLAQTFPHGPPPYALSVFKGGHPETDSAQGVTPKLRTSMTTHNDIPCHDTEVVGYIKLGGPAQQSVDPAERK